MLPDLLNLFRNEWFIKTSVTTTDMKSEIRDYFTRFEVNKCVNNFIKSVIVAYTAEISQCRRAGSIFLIS